MAFVELQPVNSVFNSHEWPRQIFFLAISSGTVRRMKENINEGILSADPKENSPNSLL